MTPDQSLADVVALDEDTRTRITAAAREIRADCARDAKERDGQVPNGANLGRWFGWQDAKIAALSGMLLALLGEEPTDVDRVE